MTSDPDTELESPQRVEFPQVTTDPSALSAANALSVEYIDCILVSCHTTALASPPDKFDPHTTADQSNFKAIYALSVE